MKLKLTLISLTLILILFSSISIIAQKNHIVVAYAIGKECGNDTDLGYQIYYGSNLSEAEKLARDKVKRNFKDSYAVRSEKNGWNADKGDYIVIIETKLKTYNNCVSYKYGIGFGFNYSEALKNAKGFLRMRSNWDENKHGYSTLVQERY
jgi:hypothetical protein